MAEYRFSHNYPGGQPEVRFSATDDQVAIGEAEKIKTKVVDETPEDARWDFRGCLTREVRFW
jgi:hypothetical protein